MLKSLVYWETAVYKLDKSVVKLVKLLLINELSWINYVILCEFESIELYKPNN